MSAWSGYGIVVSCVTLWWFTSWTLSPVVTLSLPIFWIVPLWMATTVCIYFLFRLVLFRYVRVIAHVFCPAGVLVCLFIVTVADFSLCHWKSVIGFEIALWIYRSSFLAFIFRLGSLNFFSKSFCCSYFVYSFLFGIRLCRLLLWSVFVGRNGTTDFAKTGQVSDDTINLINC